MELNGEMFNIGLSSVTLQLQQKIAADVSDYAIDYPYSMSYNNSSTEFLEVNFGWIKLMREDINNNFNSQTSEIPDMFNETDDGMSFGLFYRHSSTISIIYCIAYFVVFSVGFIGNS